MLIEISTNYIVCFCNSNYFGAKSGNESPANADIFGTGEAQRCENSDDESAARSRTAERRQSESG